MKINYILEEDIKKDSRFQKKGFQINKIKAFNENNLEVATIEYSFINSINFILTYSDPINYLNDFKLCNIDKEASKKEQLKEIFKYYKFESFNFDSISSTDKDKAIEEMYKIVIKKIRNDLKEEIKEARKEYADKAIVDFVNIDNEKNSKDGKNYRNKGILEELYKRAYQDLKKQDINLCSSISQSKEGKTIWQKLKNSGFNIEEENNRFFIKEVPKNKNNLRKRIS